MTWREQLPELLPRLSIYDTRGPRDNLTSRNLPLPLRPLRMSFHLTLSVWTLRTPVIRSVSVWLRGLNAFKESLSVYPEAQSLTKKWIGHRTSVVCTGMLQVARKRSESSHTLKAESARRDCSRVDLKKTWEVKIWSQSGIESPQGDRWKKEGLNPSPPILGTLSLRCLLTSIWSYRLGRWLHYYETGA